MTLHQTTDGFFTADNTELMKAVAERLNQTAPSLNASVQHTGGGIFCIEVQLNGGAEIMYWGTSGETWGADLNNADGDYMDESPFTHVPTTSNDVDVISESILSVAERYQKDGTLR